jgi:RimJ/RimL family protein N-acetyltransferase
MQSRSAPTVPVIETERLVMRGHRLDDFDDSSALWADPEVTRFIGGKPQTREEAWTRLLRYIGHWSVMGYGYWVVTERATGRFAGEVGFAEYRRAMEPSIEGTPEIGWVLAGWARGQGYATEAVRGAVMWGEANFGPGQRTVCIIAPGNLASIRVAEKCGYARVGEAAFHGLPTLLFSRG